MIGENTHVTLDLPPSAPSGGQVGGAGGSASGGGGGGGVTRGKPLAVPQKGSLGFSKVITIRYSSYY